MPDSKLVQIGKRSFRGTLLEEITIPGSVAVVREGAFRNCRRLKRVTLQEDSKLEKIGVETFRESRLKSVTFP